MPETISLALQENPQVKQVKFEACNSELFGIMGIHELKIYTNTLQKTDQKENCSEQPLVPAVHTQQGYRLTAKGVVINRE